jgi:hypothetical protein
MALAILIGVVLLLGLGLAVAIRTAVAARQQLEDLEAEIAESRGMGFEPDSGELWSASELEVLRDDDTELDGHDPFSTLTHSSSPAGWDAVPSPNGGQTEATWHAATPPSNGPEPEPTWHAGPRSYDPETDPIWHAAPPSNDPEPEPTWHAAAPPANDPEPGPAWQAASSSNGSGAEPNGSDPMSTTALAPLANLSPVAWRTTGDAPVVVLVVGAGFLGTGMTAGVTTVARLRQAWSQINDSFEKSDVITLEPDTQSSPPPRPHRDEDSGISWDQRSNGSAAKPSGDLKPIEWRAPSGVRRR